MFKVVSRFTHPKVFAIYYPQFHETTANNVFWGDGFTEWTLVRNGKKLFSQHQQPKIPTLLGYYDLNQEQVIYKQIKLAKKYGIDGFAIYIYYFNNSALLDAPLRHIKKLASELDFKYFFIWANESWTRVWDGKSGDVLIKQEHSSEQIKNFYQHFNIFLKSDNYYKIGCKPVLGIYDLASIKNITQFTDDFKEVTQDSIHLSMFQRNEWYNSAPLDGFDSSCQFAPHGFLSPVGSDKAPALVQYKNVMRNYLGQLSFNYPVIPSVFVNWDNTPRRGRNGSIVWGANASSYKKWLTETLKFSFQSPHKILDLVLINAWNEWGEGNYLEPDRHSGRAKLRATRQGIIEFIIFKIVFIIKFRINRVIRKAAYIIKK